MADIFLSYAREDKAKASQIANALTGAGYEVFWDAEIPTGASWADILEQKLAACRAAIVLWSKASTASQWVREEARVARDKSKLLPVLLDDSAPPFGFGEIQSANLSAWRGDQNDPHWRALLTAIERAMGAPAPTPRPMPPPRPQPAPPFAPKSETVDKKKPSPRAYAIGGAAAVLALGGLYYLGVEDDDGLQPASPLVTPAVNPGAAPAASAAVAQVLQETQKIRAEAQANAQAAGEAAARANEAALKAQSGVFGFGTLPIGQMTVSGDLGAFQRGEAGAVQLRTASGLFSGLVTVETATGRFLRMVGINQALNGTGSQAVTVFSGESGRSVGRSFSPLYSAEGAIEGVPATLNFGGIGVVQFTDGSRYEGQFRMVGAQGQIVKQGLGAIYDARGALMQSGRFDNNVYSGPG